MPTLAQMVRAKYPGAYDDLSDQQLEAQVRAKHPGAYDDLPTTQTDGQQAEPEGSALGRFASNLGSALNPVAMIKGIGQAVAHPIDTAGALIGAHVGEGRKAVDLAKQGRYVEALGHGAAAALPLVGPAAAAAGEQIATGDIAGGLGAGTGLLAGVLAPSAIGSVKGVRVPGLVNVNPVAAEAVAFGERTGIPIDAATATGNRAVAAVQHVADRSLGGSRVSEKAAAAQQRGLATVGEQLAAKAHPSAVSSEQAGAGAREAVLENVRAHSANANTAYDRLREIEADPIHRRTIVPDAPVKAEGAPLTFSPRSDASVPELFEGAWRDAKAQGFKGSRTELRGAFAEKLADARALRSETVGTSTEYGHGELLKSIRELGGIRPYVRDLSIGAPGAKLGEEFSNVAQYFNGRGRSSLFREHGLGLDDMVGQLRQDPRWASVLHDESDLLGMLEEIGGKARENGGKLPEVSGDLQYYLRGAGAEPGLPWWEPAKQPVEMALPVDLRGVKAALKPIHDELMARYPVAQQEASKGLKALQNIVNGPDHAPLSTVDANLGAIKSIARSDLPELRSVSQGTAAGAVKKLDALVRQTAADASPEALEALEQGRISTVAKYGAADVLDTINAEPVRAHGKLTTAKDGAIEHLRAVAKQAPDELPKIGRAVLDGLLEKATGEGGFGHGAKIAADWERLGPETKRLLYKDPGYISDLDNFFRLAKLTAHNANPSGTAHTLLAAGQGGAILANPVLGIGAQIGAAAVSKLLHSQAGVRLLTKGMRIPVGNAGAASAWAGELAALTNSNGSRIQTQVPAQ